MATIEQIKHPSNMKRRKRIARGLGSGSGQKAGRGQTGQKSRSGGIKPASFEGGRMPVVRKFPKIGGFKHHSKIYYHAVNLGRLAEAEDGTVVDLFYLEMQGLLPKKLRNLKVKLLGDGEFSKKLTFKLHAFSHSARARVEAAGGVCEVIE
jgi:large subunit ribosomal protein L15